jgi:hypothetical protein
LRLSVSLLALVGGFEVTLAAQAGAAGVRVGSAMVVRDAGATERRTSGGSSARFSLRLPAGASCPGDSASDGYRVQSFIVPAKDDPGALRYFSVMPVGEGRYALYDVYTNPFIQAQTAKATRPGGPGPIIDIPAFNFEVFPPGKLPAGVYHIGIACSLHNETIRYWDTDVQLTAAPSDHPAQLRWRVVGARSSGGGSSALPWSLGAAAVAAVFVGWTRRSSRRRHSDERPREAA